MTKKKIREIHEEIAAIDSGKMAAGRIWKMEKRPDGTYSREQVDPEEYRKERAAATAQEESIALTARRKLGVSQDRFAELLGISASTLRKWEQHQRQPTGAAELLLRVAAHNPEAVLAVVTG